jgi:hypothetical protein
MGFMFDLKYTWLWMCRLSRSFSMYLAWFSHELTCHRFTHFDAIHAR